MTATETGSRLTGPAYGLELSSSVIHSGKSREGENPISYGGKK